jgi:hypothetical protein
MEHRINRALDEDDACLSVTALVVVLALVFTLYFSLRVAVPDLPLRVSEQAANALSMLW